jgi:hypothetical protein
MMNGLWNRPSCWTSTALTGQALVVAVPEFILVQLALLLDPCGELSRPRPDRLIWLHRIGGHEEGNGPCTFAATSPTFSTANSG